MTASPRTLALVAFVFHAPGLRVLCGARLPRELFRKNVEALVATLIAAAAAALFFPFPTRGTSAAITFTVGHFAWSAYLARRVSRLWQSEGSPPIS